MTRPAGGDKPRSRQGGDQSRRASLALIGLVVLGVVSWLVYLRIARLSPLFDFDAPTAQRPIVPVLLLFLLAFVCYLSAIWLVRRVPQDARMWLIVIGGAVAFRAALLTSTPIQEIDIYRYVWDGAVAAQGVSPFWYSPEQVKLAHANDASPSDELRELAIMRDKNPAIAESLDRIHFAELSTVYPPTSQAVFVAAHATTPATSSLSQRLVWMKSVFIVFDLLTMALVVWLLRLAGQPPGLCLIYGWCPLLMKEVANSGHLDAVAICLTTLVLVLAASMIFRAGCRKDSATTRRWLRDSTMAVAAMSVLALAVGAKLYPVILAPLLLLSLGGFVIREHGWIRGIATSAGAATVFTFATVGLLWPMLPSAAPQVEVSIIDDFPGDPFLPATDSESSTTEFIATDAQDPSRGITTFLQRWEMNDFLFLIVIENLKPTEKLPPGEVAWFSVVPSSFRHRMVQCGCHTFDLEAAEVPFTMTRAATGVAFVLLAGGFTWRGMRSREAQCWLRCGFLTIAWFWLLCPTQNPWYWTWALPLLPFAKARTWLLVAGFCMAYYLRFWLDYHWPEATAFGTPYVGYQFFDFVVTWLEFAPILALLFVESWMNLRKNVGCCASNTVTTPAKSPKSAQSTSAA